MIQQYAAGIPPEMLERHIEDETLRGWWTTFLETMAPHLAEERHSEITLTDDAGRLAAGGEIRSGDAGRAGADL